MGGASYHLHRSFKKTSLVATLTSQSGKAQTFRALRAHGEAFLIPNPWDAGSALLLREAGFRALATTSAGLAQTLGKTDGEITLEEKLEYCRLRRGCRGPAFSFHAHRAGGGPVARDRHAGRERAKSDAGDGARGV